MTFNSFAAEVEHHAYVLKKYPDVPAIDVGNGYNSALRADMAMGEEAESGFTDGYYDLNSDIVQAQAEYHGEY